MTTIRSLPAAGALLAVMALQALQAPTAAPAQEADLQVPDGWKYRLDSPDPEVELVAHEDPGRQEIRFVTMEPGWHVTTGPRVILYRPEDRPEGTFRISATFHLFDPGQRNEAYGLFVGGRDLQSADQEYLYFLIRRSGEVLVKLREGSDTRVITDWTSHDAVVPYGDETEGTTENTLSVAATADSLRFFVNGTEVETRPRGDLPVNGIVGWRINHGLDLHVAGYSVEGTG